jgi:hypothetical protein
MEVRVVRAGHRGEELRGPGTAVAAVHGQTVIDLEGGARRERDQEAVPAHVEEIFVILDAVEAVAVGYKILVDEYVVRAFERWGDDETATLVVETGQDEGSCGCLFHTGRLWFLGDR